VTGALVALRRALAEPAARGMTSRIVLALADCSLEGGSPDTALSYASWGERGFEGEARSEATARVARAWEARGDADSALAAYGRYLDRAIGTQDSLAEARLRRAALLERAGRWEEARTEYRTLAGLHPTHPLAFEAMLRIVSHHQSKGEDEAAGIEGRRALGELDRLIATQRDGSVQWRVRNARARVQMALRLDDEAARTLAETWAAFPETAVDDTLGLRVAGHAALHPEGRERALELYRTMMTRGQSADTRRTARAAVNHLQP
jgi:tetratricopeptide (TPR) repeat protein